MNESFEEMLKGKEDIMLVRRKIHKYLSPKLIATMTPDRLDEIQAYLYPMDYRKLRKMVIDDPRLWYYITVPESDYLSLEKYRTQAMKVLEESLTSETAGLDRDGVAAFKARIDVAKTILSLTDIKSEALGQLSTEEVRKALPKSIREMSIEEIDDKANEMLGE